MSRQLVRRIAAPAAAGFLAAALLAAMEGTAAGVRWAVPKGWSAQPTRPMRVATYNIPASPGSAAGECAVFYFGRGQGGNIEDNLSRWMQQFEKAGKPRRSERRVREFRVHTIDLSGTYLAPSGPMMQPQGKLPGYRLLGAIVETPQGNVFFKSTGPATTMERARGDFDRMIDSIARATTSV
jgi:hypothetical protein